MLHIMRILNALVLLVELPITFIVDNSGDVDIANNWSSAGHTRYMDTII